MGDPHAFCTRAGLALLLFLMAGQANGQVTAIKETETVALGDADGRILARDITAPLPLPPFTNSAVDGYAVRHADLRSDGDTTLAISAEDLAAAVKERRHLMKDIVGPAAKLGGQMVKGVKPFVAEAAAKAMNDINSVPDKYVMLFPKGTEHGAIADSKAKPAVWEDFDKFKATAAKLKDASAKAAGAAAQGKDAFTAAFNDMTKVCKECHETFREKEEK